jgi:hypothetical protein
VDAAALLLWLVPLAARTGLGSFAVAIATAVVAACQNDHTVIRSTSVPVHPLKAHAPV